MSCSFVFPKRSFSDENKDARNAAKALRSFGHRSRMMQLGYAEEDFRDKPITRILDTWSELDTCFASQRGVSHAGGFPVQMPSLSVDERFTKPTSMLYRNILAMETE